ncbi:TadE/TadG family type IV pilus assembly protein [Paenibacillus massiliensis]|uniref:TadE/TadG family type IV pilus assembly protein n=1 Tax=Paenibacillus massiliensis TaxID=225917 RepID=UPI00046F28D0|nr:TadE/TadG family type IV pilus assembly protein [Paenibacillus massiliensis]
MSRELGSDEEGSFSLEASLVFPIIMLIIFILLFFCLYLYQKSILIQVAATASERAAYSWDNSYKLPTNGAVEEGKRDPLYWRMTDDAMIGALFGWAGADTRQAVAIPGMSTGQGLPQKKMSQASGAIPTGMKGQQYYENFLMIRRVTTELSKMIHLPLLSQVLEGDRLSTASYAGVVDPVEYIRTIELIRYYGPKFKGTGQGIPLKAGAAGAVIQDYAAREN